MEVGKRSDSSRCSPKNWSKRRLGEWKGKKGRRIQGWWMAMSMAAGEWLVSVGVSWLVSSFSCSYSQPLIYAAW